MSYEGVVNLLSYDQNSKWLPPSGLVREGEEGGRAATLGFCPGATKYAAVHSVPANTNNRRRLI